jgi:hypothetical protein
VPAGKPAPAFAAGLDTAGEIRLKLSQVREVFLVAAADWKGYRGRAAPISRSPDHDVSLSDAPAD